MKITSSLILVTAFDLLITPTAKSDTFTRYPRQDDDDGIIGALGNIGGGDGAVDNLPGLSIIGDGFMSIANGDGPMDIMMGVAQTMVGTFAAIIGIPLYGAWQGWKQYNKYQKGKMMCGGVKNGTTSGTMDGTNKGVNTTMAACKANGTMVPNGGPGYPQGGRPYPQQPYPPYPYPQQQQRPPPYPYPPPGGSNQQYPRPRPYPPPNPNQYPPPSHYYPPPHPGYINPYPRPPPPDEGGGDRDGEGGDDIANPPSATSSSTNRGRIGSLTTKNTTTSYKIRGSRTLRFLKRA